MLNDNTTNTTTNPTPINDLPVTMEENEAMQALEKAQHATQPEAPPLPLQDYAFMAALIRTFTKHIETLVDQRFAALVESHRTLALMNEDLEEQIIGMIDDRIDDHESHHEHKTDADIESEVAHHVEYFMRQGDHDFITERQLSEKISDVLDEILSDRINASLSNASIEISI